MASKNKCWRVSLGERGLRVYLFERVPGGPLYREVYVGGKRVAPKKSLRHRDKERAEADAYRLLAQLKSHQEARNGGKLTLATLFDMYVESAAMRSKSPRTQSEDKAKLKRVVKFLGEERDVRSLTPDDVERFRQARIRGECGTGKRVRARTVEADLRALVTALNWAERQRSGRGEPLIDRNPLRGVRLPTEKSPKQPVEIYEHYLRLIKVAHKVDWRLLLALTLAESTGRRIGAILKLRRDDVNLAQLPHGWLRFRAEHDKTDRESWVPLTGPAREVLLDHMRRLPADSEWLFPSEAKPTQPVDRSTMDKCLRKAYKRVKLATPDGGLWHAWRRKWATERKGMPVKDVAAAGGWKDTRTLLHSYQQPDVATLVHVALGAPKLTGNGIDSKVTPLPTPTNKRESA